MRAHCADDLRCEQIVLHGAGHFWPGSAVDSRLIERFAGRPNRDIDAGRVIWDSFAATLPAR